MTDPLKNTLTHRHNVLNNCRIVLNNCRIVLVGARHAGNVGAAARAMKTMGLSALVLVNPEQFPADEATRRASRATDVLENARVCATLDEALCGVALAVACTARPRDLSMPATDAREAAVRLCATAATQPVALVFGNETFGLTTEHVNRCQMIATIPADDGYSSLNLAAAVQVFAYELRMAAYAASPEIADSPAGGERASHEALEGFYVQLETALVETGYLNPAQPKKLMQRLRRLYARAALEREEVNILRGIVRTLRTPKKQ
jgi:tRNA/rRNA methyltransferase